MLMSSCTVGHPAPSTCTILCFGGPTAQLAHQYVWFCTMWPDRAKRVIKKEKIRRSYHHNCTSFSPGERQSWKSSYRGGPEHSFGELSFFFLMTERRRSICNAWYWNNRTACSKNRRLAMFVWERRAPNLENTEKKMKNIGIEWL